MNTPNKPLQLINLNQSGYNTVKEQAGKLQQKGGKIYTPNFGQVQRFNPNASYKWAVDRIDVRYKKVPDAARTINVQATPIRGTTTVGNLPGASTVARNTVSNRFLILPNLIKSGLGNAARFAVGIGASAIVTISSELLFPQGLSSGDVPGNFAGINGELGALTQEVTYPPNTPGIWKITAYTREGVPVRSEYPATFGETPVLIRSDFFANTDVQSLYIGGTLINATFYYVDKSEPDRSFDYSFEPTNPIQGQPTISPEEQEQFRESIIDFYNANGSAVNANWLTRPTGVTFNPPVTNKPINPTNPVTSSTTVTPNQPTQQQKTNTTTTNKQANNGSSWLPWFAIPFLFRPTPTSKAPGVSTATQPNPNTLQTPIQTPSSGCSPCQTGIQAGVNDAKKGIEDIKKSLKDGIPVVDTTLSGLIYQQTLDINDKMGAKLPNGGVGGMLNRMKTLMDKTWNFLQVDRILNVLTYVTVIHSALMLSNSVKDTLLSMFANVLNVFGIEGPGGESLDLNEMANKWTEGFIKGIVGEDNYNNALTAWRKWMRVLTAAANIVSAVQSIGYSILGALEVVGTWVSWVGNALRAWSVVAENAYPRMSEQPKFMNRALNALETVETTTSALDQVASETLSVQETVGTFNTLKTELTNSLGEAPGSPTRTTPVPDAQQQAAKELASKTASQSPPIP